MKRTFVYVYKEYTIFARPSDGKKPFVEKDIFLLVVRDTMGKIHENEKKR